MITIDEDAQKKYHANQKFLDAVRLNESEFETVKQTAGGVLSTMDACLEDYFLPSISTSIGMNQLLSEALAVLRMHIDYGFKLLYDIRPDDPEKVKPFEQERVLFYRWLGHDLLHKDIQDLVEKAKKGEH